MSKTNEKVELHVRNRNRKPYDLRAMKRTNYELKNYIITNKYGAETINFSNPAAVKVLNQSIIEHYYGIKDWDFPDGNLCPPIPGRAEYIHLLADLLASKRANNKIPKGKNVVCLDIGVGASCIYPIIGVTEYGWRFIGSDVNATSIESSEQIISANKSLRGKIDLRLQANKQFIFKGVVTATDKIDAVLCNPPFHSSIKDAIKGTKRKVRNLSGRNDRRPTKNFSGKHHELVYQGGEVEFFKKMLKEGKEIAQQCFWFTCLLSKETSVEQVMPLLKKSQPTEIKILNMKTGNKISRIVCWTYLNEEQQKNWK